MIEALMLSETCPSFTWLPIHIYHRAARKKDIDPIQNQFAQLGISFSTAASGLPTANHTHYLVSKILREASTPQLMAGIFQLSMVNNLWLENFILAAQPEGTKRSKLEADFLSHWPVETDYFPPVEGNPSNELEQKIWQPKLGRRDIFQTYVFIDYSGVGRAVLCSVPLCAEHFPHAGSHSQGPHMRRSRQANRSFTCKRNGIPERVDSLQGSKQSQGRRSYLRHYTDWRGTPK